MSFSPAPTRPAVEALVRSSLFRQLGHAAPAPTLVVNSSARHMHISPENLETLFGAGAKLTVHKWLYLKGNSPRSRRSRLSGRAAESFQISASSARAGI